MKWYHLLILGILVSLIYKYWKNSKEESFSGTQMSFKRINLPDLQLDSPIKIGQNVFVQGVVETMQIKVGDWRILSKGNNLVFYHPTKPGARVRYGGQIQSAPCAEGFRNLKGVEGFSGSSGGNGRVQTMATIQYQAPSTEMQPSPTDRQHSYSQKRLPNLRLTKNLKLDYDLLVGGALATSQLQLGFWSIVPDGDDLIFKHLTRPQGMVIMPNQSSPQVCVEGFSGQSDPAPTPVEHIYNPNFRDPGTMKDPPSNHGIRFSRKRFPKMHLPGNLLIEKDLMVTRIIEVAQLKIGDWVIGPYEDDLIIVNPAQQTGKALFPNIPRPTAHTRAGQAPKPEEEGPAICYNLIRQGLGSEQIKAVMVTPGVISSMILALVKLTSEDQVGPAILSDLVAHAGTQGASLKADLASGYQKIKTQAQTIGTEGADLATILTALEEILSENAAIVETLYPGTPYAGEHATMLTTTRTQLTALGSGQTVQSAEEATGVPDVSTDGPYAAYDILSQGAGPDSIKTVMDGSLGVTTSLMAALCKLAAEGQVGEDILGSLIMYGCDAHVQENAGLSPYFDEMKNSATTVSQVDSTTVEGLQALIAGIEFISQLNLDVIEYLYPSSDFLAEATRMHGEVETKIEDYEAQIAEVGEGAVAGGEAPPAGPLGMATGLMNMVPGGSMVSGMLNNSPAAMILGGGNPVSGLIGGTPMGGLLGGNPSEMIGGMTNLTGGVIGGATDLVGGVVEEIPIVGGALGGVVDLGGGILGGATDLAGGVLGGALGGVTDLGGGALGGVLDLGGGALGGLTGLAGGALGGVGDLAGGLGGLAGGVGGLAGTALGGIGDLGGGALGAIGGIGGNVLGSVGGIGGSVLGGAGNFGGSVLGGVGNVGGSVGSTLAGL